MFFRNDALECWETNKVSEALPHYADVVNKKKNAKYLIAKRIPCEKIDYDNTSLDDLLEIHKNITNKLDNIENADNLQDTFSKKENEIDCPEFSLLDLKIAIANKVLESCEFCERKCHINRNIKTGHCRVGSTAMISSVFAHTGEEAPLIPSGTIFFTGCTFDCVFCQNYDISALWNENSGYKIKNVNGKKLAEMTNDFILENKRFPLKNINYVGGDPTPNLHIILDSLKNLEHNIPLIWNSNFYNSEIVVSLLLDIFDLWLPDFKYGNNDCGLRYSGVKDYFDVLKRNFKMIYRNGKEDIIIRHLLMPGHIECCTFPILEFVHNEIPNAQVNIMEQYRPQFKVNSNKFPEINRRCSQEEFSKAYKKAKELGINYELCS